MQNFFTKFRLKEYPEIPKTFESFDEFKLHLKAIDETYIYNKTLIDKTYRIIYWFLAFLFLISIILQWYFLKN